jgi:predicted Zn-dependent peptidase
MRTSVSRRAGLKSCATFALLAAAAVPALAQPATRQAPPAAGVPKNFTLPAATRFTLPNGLPVTMVPFGQVPKVSIRLVVEAGNLHEQADQVWLADLTGKMLQEGTTSLTADALARAIAGMGGELSVAVGSDRATIGTDVLAERGPEALTIVASVAREPRLPADALARVKASMLRDLAIQKTTPQAIAQEKFASLMYGDHPYGRLFPTETMLGGYTLDAVRTFHRQHFGGNRARLYVAGVFDRAAMEAAVREAFGSWRAADAPPAPAAPAPRDRGFALVDRPDAPQSTIMIGLRVPDPSSPSWIPLDVTDALLGGSFGSRITSNIREQKGYTYSPFSTVTANLKTSHWVETADVTTAVTGPALQEIVGEITRLGKEAPAAAELQGIQKNLSGTFVVQNASRGGVIGQLAFVDRHGLGDDYLAKYVERVNAVTAEQVRQTAEQHLVASRMTIVVVGDTKAVKAQLAPYEKR